MAVEIEDVETGAGPVLEPVAVGSAGVAAPARTGERGRDAGAYKWIVLSNTTLGTLIATINSSILLISLPAIFRGIGINPLAPGESGYLLWILMGYMVVTATLLVTFGRISDMVGRVRMYNLGFAVFTVGSVLLALTPGNGDTAALELLIFRLLQGVGGAFLMANSNALITDAFPTRQRGMAMGVNQVAAIAGSLGGLLLGGVLSAIDWRLVFLVSVPVGVVGTAWSYLKLHETAAIRRGQRPDLPGNICFGGGLTVLLIGLSYGIEPYGGNSMGWTNPFVLGFTGLGLALLALFVWVELHTRDPLFRLDLFRNRAFAAGSLGVLLGAIARGGLQFMLVIWLQGIWLPLHGYSFEDTPLWAGIYTMPLLIGFLVSGPLSGALSDRFGPRLFTVGGMVLAAIGFVLLTTLPGDFDRWAFFGLLLFLGIGLGMFSAPNATSVMNATQPEARGVASGMYGAFQNAGIVLSITFFFSVLTLGLASSLPTVLYQGLTQQGLPGPLAHQVAVLPPIGVLFAAFLGYNPLQSVFPPAVAHHLSVHTQTVIFGKSFFPHLIMPAFMNGLHDAFYVSAALTLVAALAAFARGKVTGDR